MKKLKRLRYFDQTDYFSPSTHKQDRECLLYMIIIRVRNYMLEKT